MATQITSPLQWADFAPHMLGPIRDKTLAIVGLDHDNRVTVTIPGNLGEYRALGTATLALYLARTRTRHVYVLTYTANLPEWTPTIQAVLDAAKEVAATAQAWHVTATHLAPVPLGEPLERPTPLTLDPAVRTRRIEQWQHLVTLAATNSIDFFHEDQARELIEALDDVRVRDSIIVEIAGGTPGEIARTLHPDGEEPRLQRLLLPGEVEHDAARLENASTALAYLQAHTHAGETAPIDTMQALIAWFTGDDTTASDLLMLALEARPDYRLADLMLRTLRLTAREGLRHRLKTA